MEGAPGRAARAFIGCRVSLILISGALPRLEPLGRRAHRSPSSPRESGPRRAAPGVSVSAMFDESRRSCSSCLRAHGTGTGPAAFHDCALRLAAACT